MSSYNSRVIMYNFLYYLLLIIFSNYMMVDYSLIIKIISIDGLFNTIHFLKTYLNKNMTDSQIVKESYSLYNNSSLDRYIYYFIIYIVSKIINNIFWINDISIYHLIYEILIIPNILNKIINSEQFKLIKNKKEEIIKKIISKQFALGINYIAKTYLEKEVKVKYKDILPLLNNYQEGLEYILEAFKNSMIMLLLDYLKSYSPKFYYKISKYIYNYKTGENLIPINTESSKQLLLDIIDNKQWIDIIKPNSCRSILFLYKINSNNTDFIKFTIDVLNYKLIKMCACWTIASFFSITIISPIVSILLLLYKNENIIKRRQELLNRLSVFIISIIIALNSNNYPLISFISEFGHGILYNKLSMSVYKMIKKKIIKQIEYIYYNNEISIIPLIGYIIYITIIKNITGYNITKYLIPNLVLIIINTINKKQMYLLISLITTGIFSNYDIIHLTIISIIYYFIISFMDLTITNKISQINIICNEMLLFIKNEINKQSIKDIRNINFEKINQIKERINNKIVVIWYYYIINRINKINNIVSKEDYLNNQEIVKIYNENSSNSSKIIDKYIDDEIFKLPLDNFIDEISINDDLSSNIYLNSTENLVKRKKIEIIDNYL